MLYLIVNYSVSSHGATHLLNAYISDHEEFDRENSRYDHY